MFRKLMCYLGLHKWEMRAFRGGNYRCCVYCNVNLDWRRG
jgi:hypothetical protein